MAASAILLAGAAVLLTAAPASAHVVPSTTIELAVHENTITADITLPSFDLGTASQLTIPSTGAIDTDTSDKIVAYLHDHFTITSAGGAWKITIGPVESTPTEQWGTGLFPAVTTTATLTPPVPGDLRGFDLRYDAIVHQVVTADVYVVLHSDWANAELNSSRALGAIKTNTVTGVVPDLPINLDSGSAWQGFTGMLTLGISHIAEGTDHQLFLLTLLLPAPLLALRRRWSTPAPVKTAARRITAITLAFTIGHSVTLALGAIGLPVPQQPIEALIAVSILVAAAHAIRPIFPGREPVIAALFGLVHGLAFSTTLSELDLTGGQLALSLLGFNLGIEIMQLIVVVLVLPPLIILARTRAYPPFRVAAATITGIAATGWLFARIGVTNPVGTAADTLGAASPWIVGILWAAAITVAITHALQRHQPPGPTTAGPAPERLASVTSVTAPQTGRRT